MRYPSRRPLLTAALWGGHFSYDLTQLSFQGTGPDLEGSAQAWQKRRSSDDAGENGCPHFLSLGPLSGAPPDVSLPSPLPIPSPHSRARSLEAPTTTAKQQAKLQRHAPSRGHMAYRYGTPLPAQPH